MPKNTRLITAVEQANFTEVTRLIEAKSDVNAISICDYSALMLAALHYYPTILNALIEAGADVNAAMPNFGTTALIRAAEHGRSIAMVDALVAGGAIVDTTDKYGYTALMWAVMNGHVLMVQQLILHGAEVNKKNKYGQTSLDLAIKMSHLEVVFVLLDTMPRGQICAIEPQLISGKFAAKYKQAVLQIQYDIFCVLYAFQKGGDLAALPSGPAALIVSNLCPKWYQHRIHRDIALMLNKIVILMKKRAEVATKLTDEVTDKLKALSLTQPLNPSFNQPLIFTKYNLPDYGYSEEKKEARLTSVVSRRLPFFLRKRARKTP